MVDRSTGLSGIKRHYLLALRWASIANVIEKVCVWRERIDAGYYGYDDDNSAGRKPGAEPRIWSTDKKKWRLSLQDPKNMKQCWHFTATAKRSIHLMQQRSIESSLALSARSWHCSASIWGWTEEIQACDRASVGRVDASRICWRRTAVYPIQSEAISFATQLSREQF